MNRRLRVLIADDEVRVLKTIEKLIDWDGLNIELAGTASNGEEEYRKIRELQPDIVITDIKMPKMDGLDVIKKIREDNEEIQFIVVSGYKYFDYAYSALKYNVEEYLLKPIQKAELNQILSKLANRRAEAEDARSESIRVQVERARSQRILQGTFIDLLSVSGPDQALPDLTQLNREYCLGLRPGAFLVYLLQVEAEPGEGTQIEPFMNTFYKKVTAYWQEQPVIQSVMKAERMYITGLINYQPGKLDGDDAVQGLFEQALDFAQSFKGFGLTCAVGTAMDSLAAAAAQIGSVRARLMLRLVLGTNRMIRKSDGYAGRQIEAETVLGSEDISILKNAVSSGDMEGYIFHIKAVFSKLHQYPDLDPVLYFDILRKLTAVGYEVLLEGAALAESSERAFAELLLQPDHSRIRSHFIKAVAADIGELIREKEREITRPVRQVIAYLKESYDQPIGLEDAARIVDLNPVYLSVLFKRNIGTNFNDYLTRVRIENAKALLRESPFSIDEIAGRVGYGNGKYFSQVFSKTVGITPSVYRRLHA